MNDCLYCNFCHLVSPDNDEEIYCTKLNLETDVFDEDRYDCPYFEEA